MKGRPVNSNTIKFFAIFAPAVLLAACGDGGTTGSAGSAGKGGTAGTAGTGGSSGTAGKGGTGGTTGGSAGTGGTTGGSAGTGGTMMTGSGGSMMSGSGGGAMGQCLGDQDQTVVMTDMMFQDKVGACGQKNLGQEPATLDCIKMIGFTDGCSQCFDDTIHCVIMKCLNQCIADQNSQMCKDCRAMNCDPAFKMCSGL